MHQLNGAWFEVSRHATKRALDMALDEAAIRDVLGNPRHVQPATAGREIWTRDKVSAVVFQCDGFWTVVTFMWSTANGWAADRESVHSRSEPFSPEQQRAMRFAVKKRKRGEHR